VRHTISILVENEFGVLARISAMFSGQRLFYVDRTGPVSPEVKPVTTRPDDIKRSADSDRQG